MDLLFPQKMNQNAVSETQWNRLDQVQGGKRMNATAMHKKRRGTYIERQIFFAEH